MTRRHLAALRLILMMGDFVVAVAVFLVISLLRFDADPSAVWSIGIDREPAALLFGLAWVVSSFGQGLYHLRARWSRLAEAKDVLRAALVMLAVVLSALFLLHLEDVSRVFLAMLFIGQSVAAIVVRWSLRSWFTVLRRRGRNMTYMLVAGAGTLAQEFADQVEANPQLGIRVVGHLHVSAGERPQVSRPILGTIDEMGAVFRSRVVDEVAICLPTGATHYLDPVVAVAADEGKTVRVPRDPDEAILSGALQEEFGPFLVRSIVRDGQREVERVIKRLTDVVGSLLGIAVLSPVMVAAALAILAKDGRPILFRQRRVGLHGREFTIHKFRTMVADAEDRFDEVVDRSDTSGPAFKMTDDPRVTRLGRFLRRWSIDELPQLFNVLRGDMSLVGPRPAPPREVDGYDIWHRRRLSVRPGMTGLWQIQARFDEHFDDRAELDLRYIDQWSLMMDFGILIKTVPAVLATRGR